MNNKVISNLEIKSKPPPPSYYEDEEINWRFLVGYKIKSEEGDDD